MFGFVGQDAASVRHHCRNTNVVHKAAKSAPGTGTVSVYYVGTTRHVERKNKFGPRALVITRGQTVPGDKAASRGHESSPKNSSDYKCSLIVKMGRNEKDKIYREPDRWHPQRTGTGQKSRGHMP